VRVRSFPRTEGNLQNAPVYLGTSESWTTQEKGIDLLFCRGERLQKEGGGEVLSGEADWAWEEKKQIKFKVRIWAGLLELQTSKGG